MDIIKIKFCCNEMENHFNKNNIQLEDREIYIMGFDGEYQEYFEIFTIEYCPFCGKKIILTLSNERRDIINRERDKIKKERAKDTIVEKYEKELKMKLSKGN